MMYRIVDTNELWTREEIEKYYKSDSTLFEKFDTFDDYIKFLLDIGRSGEGGVVEIYEKVAIVELRVETTENPNGDLVNWCINHDANEERIVIFDKADEAEARSELAKFPSSIQRMSGYYLTVTYALEFFAEDEDGNFVKGSDYDW